MVISQYIYCPYYLVVYMSRQIFRNGVNTYRPHSAITLKRLIGEGNQNDYLITMAPVQGLGCIA